jgi:hypothetical protein
MSDERPDGILGGLPQTRPHRRSAKRPTAPAVQSAEANPQPTPEPQAQPTRKPRSQPTPEPRSEPTRKPQAKPRARATPEPTPPPPSNDGVLGTAVQAAAELAEIGLSASARALRGVLSRLPRP